MDECTHQRYKNGSYMTAAQADRKMRQSEIAWIGMRIENCEDCGADLRWADIVPVKTAKAIEEEWRS